MGLWVPKFRAIAALLAFGAAAASQPALAALDGLLPHTPSWPVGDAEFSLGAAASGTLLLPSQPGADDADASGALRLMPSLKRDYDSGLALSLNGVVAVHDRLSRGRYDGKNLEQLYGEVHNGLGYFRIGMADGAASLLAVSGPKADPDLSVDDTDTSLFRIPSSGQPVSGLFPLATSVGASYDYAKFLYVSPSILGLEVALSFTPTESIYGLPFVHQGPALPGRQVDIWEGALRYSDTFGEANLSAYLGGAVGRAEHKRPGQVGIVDLAAGLRADYPVNDDLTLSFGGAYRLTNAHAFDINQAWNGGHTDAVQMSAGATYAAWIASIEYGNGVANAVPGLPRMGVSGGQASLGYVLNGNMQLTGGWQRLSYARGAGLFYNGAARLSMDAAFLRLSLHTSE